jgi:hypothetical protein
MRILICWCPETRQPVDLQLYTDYATLARIWGPIQCAFNARTAARNMRRRWERLALKPL